MTTIPADTPRYDSAKVDVSILGESIKLPVSGKVAQNRFLLAAMTERQSSWDQKDPTKRGIPSESLINLYKARGEGQWGIILSGNTIVNPVDLEAPGNQVLNKKLIGDGRLDQFKKLVQGAKAHGSLYVVQLSHGGRQVPDDVNPNPVSASDVKLDDRIGKSFAKPRPLSVEEIKDVVNEFADAAELAHQIGADGVQLHSAHGYLLAQFLASTTNKRTDQYGGSLENRSRIHFEIIEEIQKRVPKDFSISLKINSVEFQNGGFQPEECKELVGKLEKAGVDWVELSGGTYESLAFQHRSNERESTKKRESFFLEFAEIVRPAVGQLKLYVTGGFRTAEGMIAAIKDGSTDGVGLGRPAAEEPDLPKKILSGQALSAVKTLIDTKDFGTGNVAAGTAMRQIGEHKDVTLNTADPKHIEQFQKRVGEWFGQLGEEGKQGVVSAGYPAFTISA
ncbi:hypothetical protein V8E36_002732 [Tilletia maclaganii]